jgi:phage tail protein X
VTQTLVTLSTYDLRGNRRYEFHTQVLGGGFAGIAKEFIVDAAGQTLGTRSYFANGTIKQTLVPQGGQEPEVPEDIDVSGWLSDAETMQYDGDGRALMQAVYKRGLQGRENIQAEGNQYADIALLRLQNRVDYTHSDGGNAWTDTDLSNNASGYDAAGRLTTYRYSARNPNGPDWYTHTFTSAYEGWESWQEKTVAGASTNNNFKPTTNTLHLDAYGRILKQQEHTEGASLDDRVRVYTYSGDGMVQTRREGTVNGSNVFTQSTKAPNDTPLNYQFVYAAGQQLAELQAGGEVRASLPTGGGRFSPQLAHAIYAASGAGGQTNSLSKIVGGSGPYTAGGGMATVLEGETLQSLAQRVYGTSTLWYVLADANGLSDASAPLTAGVQLKTPSVGVNGNDANTFKPYNPNEAIGSTSPGLPFIPPPPASGCNTVAMILMVVVAVVVTAMTWGAASGPIGTAMGAIFGAGTTTAAVATGITAGFVAGAAGSAASQAVGSVMGATTFSWRQVAADGITNAITMGVANGMGAAGNGVNAFTRGAKVAGELNTLGKVTLGITRYAGSVVGNTIVNRDTNFSWSQVAATALASYATAKIIPNGSLSIVDGESKAAQFINDFSGNFLDGAISATARRLVGGEKQDWRGIAVNAAAQAAGSLTISGVNSARQRSLDQDLDQLIVDLRKKAEVEGISQEKLDALPKTAAELREQLAQEAFMDRADTMQTEAAGNRFGLGAVSGGSDEWIKSAGVNGMSSDTPFFSWSDNPGTGWGLRPTDKEISDFQNMGWKDRLSFYGGMFIGLFGNIGSDAITSVKAAYEVNKFIHEGTLELLTVRFLEKANMDSGDLYFKTRDSLDQKFETLTNIAMNAPQMIGEIPAAMLEDIQDDFRSYVGYVRDRDYYDAGIAGMQLTYKTLGLVLGGYGAVKAGLAGVRSGVNSLKQLASAAKNIGQREVVDVRRKIHLQQGLDSEAGFPGRMLRKVVPGKFEAQINGALSSKNKGDVLEGRLGSALDKEGLLLDFQSKYRTGVDSNGRPVGLTEIDAETPKFIIEATEKKYIDKINQLKTLSSSPLVNPEHKPVLLLAPNAGTPQQIKLLNDMGIRLFKSIDELIVYINNN